jgi:small subunit ribosomal protein S20
LANTLQAKKRARQGEKRRQQNASQRSTMRTHLKRVIKATAEGNATLSEQEFRTMASMVDSLVNKGLIHKNKAARHKSRLSKRVKAVAA